ncbi:MAG TPA: hypothetical protein VIM68_08625 [Thermoanaerobaculia bacterium]
MSGQSDYVTFDCYRTLIDWETGIRTTFLRAARHAGFVEVDAVLARQASASASCRTSTTI